MKFAKLVRYDFLKGIVLRWYYLLLPALIGVAGAMHIHDTYVEAQENSRGTLLDYWMLLLEGRKAFNLEEITFVFPVGWMMFQAFALLIVAGYTSRDLDEEGIMVITRNGSRVRWWLSKGLCALTMMSLYYAVCMICMFITARCVYNADATMRVSAVLTGTHIQGYMDRPDRVVWLAAFVLPLMMSLFLAVLEITLEMVVNTTFAYLLLFVLQGIATYKQSVFLWGTWGMPARLLTSSIGHRGNLVLSCASLLVCLVVGTVIFSRKNLLGNR